MGDLLLLFVLGVGFFAGYLGLAVLVGKCLRIGERGELVRFQDWADRRFPA